MTDFTLPSGRVVQMKDEPSYGDEVHCVSVGLEKGSEEYLYARVLALVPELSRDEVAGLKREDGRALAAEVNTRFRGRAQEDEIPFGSPSSMPSTERNSSIRTRKPSKR